MHSVQCLPVCLPTCSLAVGSRTFHQARGQKPRHSYVLAGQKRGSFTRASSRPVHGREAPTTTSPAELNEISNKALVAMLSGSKQDAQQITIELSRIMQTSADEAAREVTQYVSVLQGLLNHTVIQEVEELDGRYKQAFDRIINQVVGSDWKLGVQGQSPEANQEPQFSTWDDVLNKKKGKSSNNGSSRQGAATASSSDAQAGSQPSHSQVVDEALYRLLGVAADATAADIKSAYRKAALKTHPDVSDAPDATQQFSQLSSAYDTLSDPMSRKLYNQYGLEGMKQHQGAQAGQGNARTAWDEFKPFKKENKRTKARAASQASASPDTDSAAASTSDVGQQPVVGDVVEYPLSKVVRQQLQDGRSHGVGLLVGRNKDRGDAKTLPEEALGLCEIEPLRQEEADSDR
ncbi:hypothetical protein ABBQ32_006858 [Trebouxia sp. C0010 RCD-2024]